LDNNIELLCPPPHRTHRLQPLDVGAFGPLANNFSSRGNQVLQETGEEILTQNFVAEYMEARTEAFKPETIIKAFKNSGIRPINAGIFSDEDFAPSAPSSVQFEIPAAWIGSKATGPLQLENILL
jgi:hypothetical protein